MIERSALNFNNAIVPQIENLCLPFLLKHSLTTFAYIRFCPSGIIHICNNNNWLEYYITNGFQRDLTRYTTEIISIKNNFAFIPRITSTKTTMPKITSVLNSFDIYNGLSIYKKTEDYVEMFNFATHKENNNIWNFYYNEVDLLKEFIIYFKSKFGLLQSIDKQEKNIILPTPVNIYDIIGLHEDEQKDSWTDKFLKNGITLNNFHFCRREIHCLVLVAHGFSVKKISKILDVSPRTIECYIDNLRYKTGCAAKSQLAEFYWNSELAGLFSKCLGIR